MRDLFIVIQTALDFIVYHLGGAICSQCLFLCVCFPTPVFTLYRVAWVVG